MERSGLARREPVSDALIEQVLIAGDLAQLTPAQRASYYLETCRSLNLNPLTRPFEYLNINGKLTLYARKDATDQLRRLHGISVEIVDREQVGDLYIVRARATTPDGRVDEATGAVSIAGLKGEALGSAVMKAECVPLDSEILTRDGFKRYDQLTVGEEVLAYDLSRDETVWTPLRAVTVHGALPMALLVSEGRQFDVRCTPDHSWAVRRSEPYRPDQRGDGSRGPRGPNVSRGPERTLVETRALKRRHRLILAAPERATSESRLSPSEAAVLGWAVTDGTIRWVGNSVRIGICQSKEEHFASIRNLVEAVAPGAKEFVSPGRQRTFPSSGRTYATREQHWWYIPAAVTRAIFARAGFRSRADLPSLVTRLAPAARRAMLDAMMRAEGDRRRVFANGDRPVLDAFQILCALEGIATGRETPHQGIIVQRMKLTRRVACAFLRLADAGAAAAWCPTTDYGTWVMRQNGRVTITGNTKAKRRVTLSIVGLGWTDESELDGLPRARVVPSVVAEGEGPEAVVVEALPAPRLGADEPQRRAVEAMYRACARAGVPPPPLPEGAGRPEIDVWLQAGRAELRARGQRRPDAA